MLFLKAELPVKKESNENRQKRRQNRLTNLDD